MKSFRSDGSKKSDLTTHPDDQYFMTMKELEEYHRANEFDLNAQQDVRISNEYYNRIIVVEYISVFLSAFSIAMAIVLNELSQRRDISVENERVVLSYIMIMTVALEITLFFRYELYIKWHVTRGLLTEFDNLISTGWWRHLLLEQAIIMLAPYPFL